MRNKRSKSSSSFLFVVIFLSAVAGLSPVLSSRSSQVASRAASGDSSFIDLKADSDRNGPTLWPTVNPTVKPTRHPTLFTPGPTPEPNSPRPPPTCGSFHVYMDNPAQIRHPGEPDDDDDKNDDDLYHDGKGANQVDKKLRSSPFTRRLLDDCDEEQRMTQNKDKFLKDRKKARSRTLQP